MSEPRVITKRIDPPIPVRTHDWAAWYDGNEKVCGFGRTEEDAIQDLDDRTIYEYE